MKPFPLLWPLAVGAIGFVFGLVGPLMFSVNGDPGTEFGLLITGPAGLVVGFVLGLVVSFVPVSPPLRYSALAITCAGVGILAFYFSLPAPAYQGRIVDAEIVNCEIPATLIGNAIERWETEIARTTSNPRPDWRQDMQRSAQNANGVVLQMHVFRERPVYENRKPWDRGTLAPQPWQVENEMKLYYARGGGNVCEGYLSPGRKLYFPISEHDSSGQWPPETLPALFDMQVLAPLPSKYRSMTTD